MTVRTTILAAGAVLLAVHPSAGAERSCEAEAGSREAATYVERCILVSPATRPPCNAANPCGLILDEIRRGCGLIAAGGNAGVPEFCGAYIGGKGG